MGSALSFIKNNALHFLLYLTCCLPFLRILPINSDMQPYAFIVSFIYLVVYRNQLFIPKFHRIAFWIFALIAVMAGIQLVFNRDLSVMLLIRKVYNYAALYFISLALVNSVKKTQGLKENWIKAFVLLWFVVGAVQILFDREFLSFLVSNYRTNKTRGVGGLASEPSFYGYVMVFFIVLSNEFKRGKWLFQIICVLQIVAFAQSAVSFVYLVVFALMFVISEIIHFGQRNKREKLKRLLIAVASVVVLTVTVLIVIKTMSHTRFVAVWTNLFSRLDQIRSLKGLFAVDGSVALRVEAIIIAFQGFAQMWGFPNGFGRIQINGIEYERIMSGYGAVIYELGILGIILILVITIIMVRGLKNGFVFGIGILICMFSAIQPGSPLFIFVFACALYAKDNAQMYKLDIDCVLKKVSSKLLSKKIRE